MKDVIKASKKLKNFSVEEIAEAIESEAKKKGIDIDKLISKVIEWARLRKSRF